jgi:hypothetical protein
MSVDVEKGTEGSAGVLLTLCMIPPPSVHVLLPIMRQLNIPFIGALRKTYLISWRVMMLAAACRELIWVSGNSGDGSISGEG